MNSADALPGGEVIVYKTPDGQVRVDVRLERDTVWLTQAQMVELFGRDQSVISRHVRNVFADGELPAEGNMQKMHIASADKPTALYSLDVIISIGYRVKSARGVQFRQWATRVLREHLVLHHPPPAFRIQRPRAVSGTGAGAQGGRRGGAEHRSGAQAGRCHRPLHANLSALAAVRRRLAGCRIGAEVRGHGDPAGDGHARSFP